MQKPPLFPRSPAPIQAETPPTGDKRKPGRPTKAEVEARGEPVEVEAAVANAPNRVMVVTYMNCCGRWDKPHKIKDFPDRVLVLCSGCGKRVTLYPMRQVVH